MPSPAPAVAASSCSSSPFCEDEGRVDRLVLAAAHQIVERGVGVVSARSVAAAVGSSASAINYNFGGIEHLFSSVFDYGAARTIPWLQERAEEIAALPRTARGAALALEYVIDRWTGAARPLALVYQECLAAGDDREPAKAWIALWREFWRNAAMQFGLGEIEGRLLHLMFESEALYHLSSWSPALERATLGEVCAHLGTVWLGAGPSVPTGALALAVRTAGVISADALPPSAVRIAEAAAAVIKARGVGGLTHRAVAARAKVTTGAVTHHFRRVEDLVAGALRGQVLILARPTTDNPASSITPIDGIATIDQFAAAVRKYAAEDEPPGWRPGRRPLFLAAVRRSDLASAGAVIHFTQGATTRDALARFYRLEDATLSLHAGVLSRLASSIRLGCAGEPAAQDLRVALADEIVRRLVQTLERD